MRVNESAATSTKVVGAAENHRKGTLPEAYTSELHSFLLSKQKSDRPDGRPLVFLEHIRDLTPKHHGLE